jgi:hypothetical protein
MAEASLDGVPPGSAYIDLPQDFGCRFTVSVDTEEAFDWAGPFRRTGHTTGSARALPGFQARMDAAGIRPLYLVAHALAVDDLAADILGGLHAAGNCTIGAHLHPWTTPPFEEQLSVRNSFGGNLPEALERAKLRAVTEAIEARLGVRPTVFRAGRYGVGPHTARTLAGLGYTVDVSARSRFDYRKQGGPGFARVRPFPFRIREGLLEIPLSGTYLGRAYAGPGWPRLNASLVRLRALRRVALTPEGVSAADTIAALRRLADEDVRLFSLSFHSPSLEPGHTPFVRTAADLAHFNRWWDTILDYFAAQGIAPAGVEEIQLACRGATESFSAAKSAA